MKKWRFEMSGLNKVMLIGHLGADPELRYTQAGAPVTNFNMATTESWNDREGGKKKRTEWHKVVVFGKLAEICNDYLRKGRQAYVEGRLQTRQWDDRDGNKRYTTEVVARDVIFLGGGGGTGGYAGGGHQAPGQPSEQDGRTHGYSQPSVGQPEPDYGIPEDDDYPF
jgi:single-strand DNA-binding protein